MNDYRKILLEETNLEDEYAQSIFRKIQRTSVVTSVMTALIAIMCAALAVWVAVENANFKLTDWSTTVFWILLCALAVFLTFTVIWTIIIRIPYRACIHSFIARGFAAHPQLLSCGGDVRLEAVLIADRLLILREGTQDMAEYDLASIKNYTVVCSDVYSATKKYVKDYYFKYGEQLGIHSVTLTEKIHATPKERLLLSPDKHSDRSRSYFIKKGLI